MNKPELAQKKRLAVAYLVENKDERPESLKKFFDKLDLLEESSNKIMSAIKNAEASLNELYQKREQLVGSINAIVDMTADELPESECIEWAKKCRIPTVPQPGIVPQKSEFKKQENLDIAGSTSRSQGLEVEQ